MFPSKCREKKKKNENACLGLWLEKRKNKMNTRLAEMVELWHFEKDLDTEILPSSATWWLFNDGNFALQLSGSDTFSLYHLALSVTVIAPSGGAEIPLSSFSHAPFVSHLLTPVIDDNWPFVESRSWAFWVRDEFLSPGSPLIPCSFSLPLSAASV